MAQWKRLKVGDRPPYRYFKQIKGIDTWRKGKTIYTRLGGKWIKIGTPTSKRFKKFVISSY